MKNIPPFKLVPQPLTSEAKSLPTFKWASPEIGTRHQLGGDPSFIQRDEYPICPDCGNPMTFYAQIDSVNDDICLADCGMVYVFVCFDCFKTTSFIQSN
jgi:uncharacterized protein YwqG